MNQYTVPMQKDQTHRVMQDLGPKGIQEAIQEHDEILCDSCDQVIGAPGSTLLVGDPCWNCGIKIVAFVEIYTNLCGT